MRPQRMLVSLLILICAPLAGLADGSVTDSAIVIHEVTTIDVSSGVAIPDQTVVVVRDRIAQIGPSTRVQTPPAAAVIDGEGLFLIPGLFDAHVHYADPASFGNLLVANGVVFVRDMGLPNELILPIRDRLHSGELFGPEMVATGYILDGNPPLVPSVSIGLRTPEAARQAVRDQAAAGADMIKVYSRLRLSLLDAILDEAAKLGLKVVGHVPHATTIRMAAELGLASCEHFFGFDKLIGRLLGEPIRRYDSGMGRDVIYFRRLDEVDPEALAGELESLRRTGLSVCPTLATFQAGTRATTYFEGGFEYEEYVSPTLMEAWRELWPHATDEPEYVWQTWASLVAILHEAGIPLLVGTDLSVPGVIPGFSVHQEMEIWQAAGIPAADVLRSATAVPAEFMDVGNRVGTLEAGKTASMVLLRANPLEDISHIREIEAVFLRGRYLDRVTLDRLLDDVRSDPTH